MERYQFAAKGVKAKFPCVSAHLRKMTFSQSLYTPES